MSIKFAPLLRFVASSWGSMPSFIEGDDKTSAFVKIHCAGVDVEGGRVGVCGELAMMVDHSEEISQSEAVIPSLKFGNRKSQTHLSNYGTHRDKIHTSAYLD